MPFVKVKHNYDFESPLPLTLNEISVESFKSFLYQPIVGNINWVDIMAIIYLSGAMFILARVVFAFFKIYNLLINGDPIGEEETREGRNYWLLKSNDTISSYSFFNFLILNRDDLYYNRSMITDHEEVHIGQWHSFDVLLLELVQIFCWFNPLVEYYKQSLREIHEFIADSIVAEEEKATYAEFLFAYNFRTNASTLSNNFFNDSLLKERIMMIMKARSGMWVAAKYALIIPMVAIIGYFIVVKDIRRGDDAWKPQWAVKR
ncbi:hypothetical protein GCM10011514_41540 [Emticicia aquatilis]|uniref:Peptidase M56 domain-containing protein n=1 Tax=Emticicia aquatilis TaxID=1537369 RepID=A0A917DV07_9BACT|nr:M56 family metallopeptidase [Emticicia aquatilis]GGD73138.1 hypothetical protein GCM10011514_41540 [Emticicia aquatilis]